MKQHKKIHFYDQVDSSATFNVSMTGGYHLYNCSEDDTYRLHFLLGGEVYVRVNRSEETTVIISTLDLNKKIELDDSVFNTAGQLDKLTEQELELFGVKSRQVTALHYAIFGLLNNGPFNEYRGSFKII